MLTDEEFAERVERLRGLNARYDEEIATNKMGIGHWAEMGQPNRLTSLIMEPANGRLPPLTAEGERRSATMTSSWSDIPFDEVSDFNALDRCITRGMPASMFPFMYNSGIEIMQAPGYVVIRLELVHETRVVPVDGRAAARAEIVQWLGESRGRFEGDTLVIETTNFNGETPMLIVGPGGKPIPTSREMRIVERLTRAADDTIDYEIAVEDPVVLTRAVEGGVSAAARRRLPHVRVRLPRGQLGRSQLHRRRRVSSGANELGNTMTKPGDPTRPTGDERDRALARLEKALGEALERQRSRRSRSSRINGSG